MVKNLYLENVEYSHVRDYRIPANKRVPRFCHSDHIARLISHDRNHSGFIGSSRVAETTRRIVARKLELGDKAIVIAEDTRLGTPSLGTKVNG